VSLCLSRGGEKNVRRGKELKTVGSLKKQGNSGKNGDGEDGDRASGGHSGKKRSLVEKVIDGTKSEEAKLKDETAPDVVRRKMP